MPADPSSVDRVGRPGVDWPGPVVAGPPSPSASPPEGAFIESHATPLIPLRPRSIGEILDATFQLYRSRFAGLVLIATVGLGPISLVTAWFWLYALDAGEGSTAETVALTVIGIASFIPLMLVYGALTWGAARAAEGREVRVGEAYARSARAFPALFGAGVVAFLALSVGVFGAVVLGFLMALPFVLLGAAGGDVGQAIGTVIGGLVGVAAAFLAFAVLTATFFALLPLTVLDRKGPIASLNRSFALSKGGRLKIVAVLFVAWLIILLPTMGISMIFIGPMATFDPAASANMPATMLALQNFANFASSILTTPFLVASIVLLYYDRRVATEALDLERAVDELAAGA